MQIDAKQSSGPEITGADGIAHIGRSISSDAAQIGHSGSPGRWDWRSDHMWDLLKLKAYVPLSGPCSESDCSAKQNVCTEMSGQISGHAPDVVARFWKIGEATRGMPSQIDKSMHDVGNCQPTEPEVSPSFNGFQASYSGTHIPG